MEMPAYIFNHLKSEDENYSTFYKRTTMHILVGSQNLLSFKAENLGVIASVHAKCKAPPSDAWFFRSSLGLPIGLSSRMYEYLQKKKNFANQESFILIPVQNSGL